VVWLVSQRGSTRCASAWQASSTQYLVVTSANQLVSEYQTAEVSAFPKEMVLGEGLCRLCHYRQREIPAHHRMNPRSFDEFMILIQESTKHFLTEKYTSSTVFNFGD